MCSRRWRSRDSLGLFVRACLSHEPGFCRQVVFRDNDTPRRFPGDGLGSHGATLVQVLGDHMTWAGD